MSKYPHTGPYDWHAADLLFDQSGGVKLPKMTALAVGMTIRNPRRCLTRQPTLERAEAVAAATREQIERRGYKAEVRRSVWQYVAPAADDFDRIEIVEQETFGVYLAAAS